jgi:ribosomal protein S8
MLTVSSQDSSAVMFFRDGMIISTRDRRRKAKDPFKEYLTRYGVLNREELIRITQISSQSKLDLLDILSSEGFMSEEELHRHYLKQIQETLHIVLTWDQCSYKFISNEDVVKSIRTIDEFNIEGMLMESMRRIDEFPQMLEMFPNDQILVTRADKEDDSDKKSTNETTILALLDDIMSIKALISCARMPLFEVYESLKSLKDKGLIKTKDEHIPANGETATEAAAAKAGLKLRRNPLPFVAALLLFGATLFMGIHGFVENFDAHSAELIESFESNSIVRNQVEENLRWLIEGYRAQYGAYPAKLTSLEDVGLASPRLMKMADLFSFRYRLTPGRPAYTLL